MAKCDLCSSRCESYELATLRTEYQAEDIKDLCPKCRKWADNTKNAMVDAIAPSMRRAVKAKKAEYQGDEPKHGIFKHIFKLLGKKA